jgi:multidrug resistance efflux pump
VTRGDLSCWLWRRAKLSELGVSIEQQQIYAVGAAAASYRQALNRLAKAQLNLSWTEVRSPVDGWVDGYFEETTIGPIADGDPASVWLMGFPQGSGGTSTVLAGWWKA